MPRGFYRVMLGRGHIHAATCFAGGFIGVDDGGGCGDLTAHLGPDFAAFNHWFIPQFLARNPGRSRIAAGLAGGVDWMLGRGIGIGDIVLSPDGIGSYELGEMTGPYEWVPAGPLPHRRAVRWLGITVPLADLSEALRRSVRTQGTVIDISRYRDELELLLRSTPESSAQAAAAEELASFAMERHLEDFLVRNWIRTELGARYDIYADPATGELIGQQYATDTGPMDVLAVSKDGKELLVVELKKGRASDSVVGQILRYMGYVQAELAEPGQSVRGAIIAQEDDARIRRALAMVPLIDFYRYEISFTLARL